MSNHLYPQKPKWCDTSLKCWWQWLKVIENKLKSENGLQVVAADANKLWTRHNEQLTYQNKERKLTCPDSEEEIFCVNKIKNATSSIQQSIYIYYLKTPSMKARLLHKILFADK